MTSFANFGSIVSTPRHTLPSPTICGPTNMWWRKYLQRFGIDGNAYRFRHTFADALRTAGYMDNEIVRYSGMAAAR
jgi:integrase